MPSHACVDPFDQYSQAEVLVEFEAMAGEIRLISAHDASDDDILPDLDDVERHALVREILDDYRRDAASHGGPPHRSPTMDHWEAG